MHLDPKFWLAISFFIFLGLMIKYAMPAIIKMIDDGVKKVANDVMHAKSAKEQAEKLLSDAEQYYQESLTFSKKLITDAEIEAANLIASSQKMIEEELGRKVELTTRRIKVEEERAVREIKSWLISSSIGAIKDNVSKINEKKSADAMVNKSIIDVSKLIN